jgi:hypothetical protein
MPNENTAFIITISKTILRTIRVPFKIQEKQFKDKTEVILWMIDNQLGRRNISKYDRTRLNLKKEDILRPIAKAISLSNLKQNSSDVKKSEPRGRVVEQIAKASKVSHDTVSKVKYIEQKADEEKV